MDAAFSWRSSCSTPFPPQSRTKLHRSSDSSAFHQQSLSPLTSTTALNPANLTHITTTPSLSQIQSQSPPLHLLQGQFNSHAPQFPNDQCPHGRQRLPTAEQQKGAHYSPSWPYTSPVTRKDGAISAARRQQRNPSHCSKLRALRAFSCCSRPSQHTRTHFPNDQRQHRRRRSPLRHAL